VEAFFLGAANGQRFCLLHLPPAGHAVQGGVVYIHPFAEELNRSRRMAAQQARAFAQAGYAVLQIDLDGCGDSTGEFGEASWASWVADVVLARQYLAGRLRCAPQALWLWGLRSGCLLAAAAVSDADDAAAKLLFWQPVLSGQQHLNQFLRLKMATDLVQGKRGVGTADMVQQLAAGQSVEVGGYAVAPALAHGLALSGLDVLGPDSRVACFEVSTTGGQLVSPALSAQLARWQLSGYQATGQAIEGPLFWQAVDSDACPALVAASLGAVQRGPD
jgi:exosortase A-associated hydrolase 2